MKKNNTTNTMDSDVNATIQQLTKIIPPHSDEPFVVETKTTTTTTTTTTVTKRICVGKDANVDLTEIQALLDNNDDNDDKKLTTNRAAAAAILDEVPPKVNVITNTTTTSTATNNNKSKQRKNETTVDTSKCDTSRTQHKKRNTPPKRLSDENRSQFLSSTKIEDSLKSSQNKSPDSFKEPPQQQQKRKSAETHIVCSPNLSKISANSSGKSNSSSSNSTIKTKNIKNNNSKAINKTPTAKQVKKKRKKPSNSTRVKCEKMDSAPSRRLRSTAVENQGPNYIDDLISKYIALDKKPAARHRKKKTDAPPKVVQSAPVAPQQQPPPPPQAIPQPPPIDLPDLSAIFESSTEGDATATTVIDAGTVAAVETAAAENAGSSSFQVPGYMSPVSLPDLNDDYDMGADDDDHQMPIHSSTANDAGNESELWLAENIEDVGMPLKEHTKSNRTKRKLPDTVDKETAKPNNDDSKRSKKNIKKESTATVTKKATAKAATAATKTTAKKPTKSVECDSTTVNTTAAAVAPKLASAINESVRSAINYSPIKLYSPSNRGRLRSIAKNKLILSKRSMAKKLQNLPTPSKKILDRFDASHPLTIDADSRLIYYPNRDGDDNDNDDDDGTRRGDTTSTDKNSSKRIDGLEIPLPSNKSGMDFLMKLKQTQRPLLVKEIDADNS